MMENHHVEYYFCDGKIFYQSNDDHCLSLMFKSIHGSSDHDESPDHVTFHEIWSCASDLHSKDHEYLIFIIASDCDDFDSLFKTHHRRNIS